MMVILLTMIMLVMMLKMTAATTWVMTSIVMTSRRVLGYFHRDGSSDAHEHSQTVTNLNLNPKLDP